MYYISGLYVDGRAYLPNASQTAMLTHRWCQFYTSLCWKYCWLAIFVILGWFRDSMSELLQICTGFGDPANTQGNHLFRSLSPRSREEITSPPVLFPQCWGGSHWLLHRDRRHGGENQAREDPRHLWPRDADALTEELHGPDGGPVHLHSRRAAGGRDLREHRGPREEPVLLHPEADADWTRRECHRHGAGVQGEDWSACHWNLWNQIQEDQTSGSIASLN